MYQYNDFDRRLRARARTRSSATSSSASSPASSATTTSGRCGCRTAGTSSAMRRCCASRSRTACSPPRSCASWREIARELRPRLRPLHDAPEHPVQLVPLEQRRRHPGRARRGAACTRIQTCGNCIRNITTDHFAGVAADEIVDPRPFCEIMRQWSTLHPEFAYLPRKFKIAVNGAREDRAATACARHRPAAACATTAGELGFQVLRRRRHGPHADHRHGDPRVPAVAAAPHLPRGDPARLQPLRPARQHLQGAHQDPGEGARAEQFRDDVEAECARSSTATARAHAHHAGRARARRGALRAARAYEPLADDRDVAAPARRPRASRAGSSATCTRTSVAGYRAVTLSLKRAGQCRRATSPPTQMEARRRPRRPLSALGELRVTHEQNLMLPDVRAGRPARAVARRARRSASRRRTSACSPTSSAAPAATSARSPTRARSRSRQAITRALRRPRLPARHRRDRPQHSAAA